MVDALQETASAAQAEAEPSAPNPAALHAENIEEEDGRPAAEVVGEHHGRLLVSECLAKTQISTLRHVPLVQTA